MYGVKTGGFDSLEALHTYYDGVADGLRCYAWHRDGTQYVGTTGTTLAEALEDVNVARTAADQRMKAQQKEREEVLRLEAERQRKDDGENTPIPQGTTAPPAGTEPPAGGQPNSPEATGKPAKRKRRQAGAAAGAPGPQTNESGEDEGADDEGDEDDGDDARA